MSMINVTSWRASCKEVRRVAPFMTQSKRGHLPNESPAVPGDGRRARYGYAMGIDCLDRKLGLLSLGRAHGIFEGYPLVASTDFKRFLDIPPIIAVSFVA